MKNVALIGFMGSGKSTLAALLAKKLHAELVEVDDNIVRLSGYTSVNEIFDRKGEKYFRELEIKALATALNKTNQVISCGGGVVSSEEEMNMVKKNAMVVFLHADFKTVIQRLKDTHSRPLFRDREKAMALFAQRLPLYKKYADIEVETDDNSPEEIAEIIITRLNKYAA